VWVLGIKEAGTRAWIFLLPMLSPLLLPFKAGNQLHWWLLHAIQTQIWAHGFNGCPAGDHLLSGLPLAPVGQ
jgi:hypothetical protein